MLAGGVIEESSSSWSSPIVLVKKKNTNRLRFCADYRALNEVTIKDSYALTNILDALDVLTPFMAQNIMQLWTWLVGIGRYLSRKNTDTRQHFQLTMVCMRSGN